MKNNIWNNLTEKLDGKSNVEYIQISKSGMTIYFETRENICFLVKIFHDEFSFKVKENEYHSMSLLESILIIGNFLEENKGILEMFGLEDDGEYKHG